VTEISADPHNRSSNRSSNDTDTPASLVVSRARLRVAVYRYQNTSNRGGVYRENLLVVTAAAAVSVASVTAK
jgi:hypothetical protein